MILVGDSVLQDIPMRVDVAVVGAGAVGVAIATRLMGRVGRIALIEAGGSRFEHDEQVKFFKAARICDLRHQPTELYRRRMLGGTTSIWGGRCIPLDPEDFLPVLGRSGWPIRSDELTTHIADALEFFDAGRPEFSAQLALRTLPISPDRSDGDLRIDRIERFSPPTNVWKKWRTILARSSEVVVIHRAACTNIVTNAEGTRAVGLEIRTVSNTSRKIFAASIVLACGGLETPRLLLASREHCSRGLGNEHDLVGRFYMTHLNGNVGYLCFTAAETARDFDYALTPDGVYARRLILLSAAARDHEGIFNIVFRPTIPPIDDASHHDPVLSAMFLSKRLIIPEYARRLASRADGFPGLSTWRNHGANIALGLPRLLAFGLDWMRRRILARRKLPSVFLYRADATYPLEFSAEQLPNSESRVVLGSETDPLGVPRLIVKWHVTQKEIVSICDAYQVLASAVSRIGLGTLRLNADLQDIVRSNVMPCAGHHIGTVRMGHDARTGVVDPNAEVWGTRGLFVAGSAIFPTSGFANPTLTAVALAFRLAEHIVQQRKEANTQVGVQA